MVKKIIIFGFLLSFMSCCDLYLNSSGGMRSKRMYKKYLTNRINPKEANIRTDVLYQRINYLYNEQTENLELFKDQYPNDCLFFKFYDDGTFYSYKVNDKEIDKLDKNDLLPSKGDINFLVKRADGIHMMDYSSINCGAFSKNEYKLKGDTLMISAGSNKGYRLWYYYVERQVSKELLTQNSDIN